MLNTSTGETKSSRPSLNRTTTFFKTEDVRESTMLPDTTGAFSDLYCGLHLEFGKVALKRLRFTTGKPHEIFVSKRENCIVRVGLTLGRHRAS